MTKPLPPELRRTPNRMNSPVVAVKPDGGIALYFNNPSEAVRVGGINSGNLYQALQKKKKTANGYMWYYREEHERLWFENPDQLKWQIDPNHTYFKSGAKKGHVGFTKGKKLKFTERGLERRREASRKGHERRMREGTYEKIAEKNRRSVVCVETGQVYPSVTDCANALGVNTTSVCGAIKHSHKCRGHHYIYQQPDL